MKTTQEIIREIERLYVAYEKEVRLAKEKEYLKANTEKTYLLHSGNFVKWCQGNFTPGGRHSTR